MYIEFDVKTSSTTGTFFTHVLDEKPADKQINKELVKIGFDVPYRITSIRKLDMKPYLKERNALVEAYKARGMAPDKDLPAKWMATNQAMRDSLCDYKVREYHQNGMDEGSIKGECFFRTPEEAGSYYQSVREEGLLKPTIWHFKDGGWQRCEGY